VTHVVVTGAAGAIGGAIARRLGQRDATARLTLVDLDLAGTAMLAAQLGRHAVSRAWDLSAPDALPELVASLTEQRGPIEVLVNCAGIMEMRSLAATPWALAERLLAIDLHSPLRLMSLVTPSMIAARRGTIINVSSLAGLTPVRGCAYYGAAKAGLAMASEIARLELAPHGVRVVTVYPGPVHSALERRSRSQVADSRVARWLPTGDPDVLARRIADTCAGGGARVFYPALYDLAGRLPGIAALVARKLSPPPLDA
jgi:short-subunit dehydrogenase